ncbi:hypothetical protein ACTFIW_005436 [Dictyostelium discoideum]
MKHPDFALPGRKELLKSDVAYVVIVIDTNETPIQRHKKTKEILFRKKEFFINSSISPPPKLYANVFASSFPEISIILYSASSIEISSPAINRAEVPVIS